MSNTLTRSPARTQQWSFSMKGDKPRSVLELLSRSHLEQFGGFILPIILQQRGWKTDRVESLPAIILEHHESSPAQNGLNPCTLWEWIWLISMQPGDATKILEACDVCVFGADLKELIISMNDGFRVIIQYANERRRAPKEILMAGFKEE